MKLTPYQAHHQKNPEKETRVEYFTLKKVSKETGISISILNKRGWKLGLKGKCLGKGSTMYYTKTQINKMLAYVKTPKSIDSCKITIIELYQKNQIGRDIAKYMKISVKTTYDCIREYNETGCVTVESKINKLYE